MCTHKCMYNLLFLRVFNFVRLRLGIREGSRRRQIFRQLPSRPKNDFQA